MFFQNKQNIFNIKSFFPQTSTSSLEEISTYNNGATRVFKWNSLSVVSVDLANEYVSNAVVRAVVDRFSNAISSLEPMIMDTSLRKRDKDHIFNIILKRPNREQTWRELIRDIVNDQLIFGSYYLYLTLSGKNIVSIKRILPTNVTKSTTDKEGNVVDYDIKFGDNNLKVKNLPYDDPKSVILKQTFYSPESDLFKEDGTSPLESASNAISHINTANKYNLSFLQNGARPSIAFIVKPSDGYDGTLTEEQRTILQEQLNNKYAGSENAGRPLLLEGGIEIQNLSSNMKDMDFSNLIELSIRMIFLVMGIPFEESGYINAKSYNSSEESRKAFMINSILPFADNLYEKLNVFLMNKYDTTGKYKLTYNKNDINILTKDILEVMSKAKETEAYTINEVRAMNNLDAVKDGDDVRVSMTTAPLGSISKNFDTNINNMKQQDETKTN